MAELADALASGASLRKEVQVQVLLPAPLVPIVRWEHSSAGRASALQAEGHRFEPCCSQKRPGTSVSGLILFKATPHKDRLTA